jgi:hypothetical protein
MVGLDGMCQYQSRMTFAIARHALVDLCQVFSAKPDGSVDRLSDEDLAYMRENLRTGGVRLHEGEAADAELKRIRALYEPYAIALARHLRLELPPWVKHEVGKDNWQTTAWQQRQSLTPREKVAAHDDHF